MGISPVERISKGRLLYFRIYPSEKWCGRSNFLLYPNQHPDDQIPHLDVGWGITETDAFHTKVLPDNSVKRLALDKFSTQCFAVHHYAKNFQGLTRKVYTH